MGLLKFVGGWLLTANRWALCMILLGAAGVVFGTKAEVPTWLCRIVIQFGGQSLKSACESIVKQYG